MNRFEIPMNLQCKICTNVAVYDCKAMNKKICRFCCDNYQLSNKEIDKCLECEYLFRDVGYEVKFNMVMMIYHEYKNKFVFDSIRESYHLKVIEMYKRLGVDTVNEMFNLAIQYYYANRVNEALDLYNIIIKKNISNEDKMDLYEKIGDALLMLDRIPEARDAYVKSLDYGNIMPKIYRRLGEVYNSLKEYSQSVYYHEKSLNAYLSGEWHNDDNWNVSDDFLYFTNYCSLATSYSEFKKYDKVIENANAFLDYYGDFEYIKERFFVKGTIDGDCFMPELVISMYNLISLTYLEIKDFSQAKDNIKRARVLSPQDVELARIDGFIDGKIDTEIMALDIEQLRQQIVEKSNAAILLIKSIGDKPVITYNVTTIQGDVYMGNKYNVENSGTIENQVFGDNVTFSNAPLNNSDLVIKEINDLLSEISEKISVIGNAETQNHIDEINESIKNRRFLGLKVQLSNLLVGITAGCIANNIPQTLTKLSEVISKFQ